MAAAADVEGVGLFRTEFLFLDRATAPTVEEQTATYTAVFESFAGKYVVVRTLDAGADKPLPFADLGPRGEPGARRARAAAVASSGPTCSNRSWPRCGLPPPRPASR